MNLGRAGLVIKICAAGTLATNLAEIIAKHGPPDALKSTVDITVDGVPADALSVEPVTGFPVSAGVWDPTGWASISAIHGTSPSVWAGWYSRVALTNTDLSLD